LSTTGVKVKFPHSVSVGPQTPGVFAVMVPGNSNPIPVILDVTPATSTFVTLNVIDPLVREVISMVACRFGSEAPDRDLIAASGDVRAQDRASQAPSQLVVEEPRLT
jgi:hypothetical protein